jgi:hypothetical protein
MSDTSYPAETPFDLVATPAADAALTRIAGELPPRPALHVYRCPKCASTESRLLRPIAGDGVVTCGECGYLWPCCHRSADPAGHPVTFAEQVRYELAVQGLTLPAELAGTVS